MLRLRRRHSAGSDKSSERIAIGSAESQSKRVAERGANGAERIAKHGADCLAIRFTE